MPIAKITGQGLVAIGFSVALLWGCVIGQRQMARQAYVERVRVMREIEIWQRHRPKTTPAFFPLVPQRIRPTAG